MMPIAHSVVNKTLGLCATQKNSGELCLLIAKFSSSSALQLTSLFELMQRLDHRLAGNPDQSAKGLI